MGLFDLFKPVKSISPDQVRTIIKEKSTEQYCLLDVRQRSEYESGHLPGAKLITLGELQARLKGLDPEKYTIVYCRSGSRSRAASGILTGAGLKQVYNMEGGIIAYTGVKAVGLPESGMFCFPESLTPAELAAVAWLLEDGNLRFLDSLSAIIKEKTVLDLILKLHMAKAGNKAAILKLYKDLTSKPPDKDFPRSVLESPPEDIMAGCVKVSDAQHWMKGKNISDILELMIALEANTLDLYLKMGRLVKAKEARHVFKVLSGQETHHLELISSVFEKGI